VAAAELVARRFWLTIGAGATADAKEAADAKQTADAKEAADGKESDVDERSDLHSGYGTAYDARKERVDVTTDGSNLMMKYTLRTRCDRGKNRLKKLRSNVASLLASAASPEVVRNAAQDLNKLMDSFQEMCKDMAGEVLQQALSTLMEVAQYLNRNPIYQKQPVLEEQPMHTDARDEEFDEMCQRLRAKLWTFQEQSSQKREAEHC
jgi:hypothetical protein